MAKKTVNVDCPEILWSDRKRHLGLPISFTKYSVCEDRIFLNTGFFNTREDEVLLYRVRDLRLTRTLGQRIFGVGTICVISTDKSIPHLNMTNVKNPKAVKELLFAKVEESKKARRMRTAEILDDTDDIDDDNIDDCLDA